MSNNIEENIIFKNGPLYRHLKDANFGDMNDLETEETVQKEPIVDWNITNSKKKKTVSVGSILYDYIFDEGWKNSQKKLYYQFSNRVIGHSLQSKLLNEFDSTYIETFAESNTFDDSSFHSSESILNQLLTQMSVLCITIGYALMRMLYFKSSSELMPSYLLVYGLDVLSLFMTILALMPVAIRFSSTGKMVGQIRKMENNLLTLLSMLIKSRKIFTKSILFVREMEVLMHGYTYLNAPIARLEKGLHKQDTLRRYSDLRYEIYKAAVSNLLYIRSLTLQFLALFPDNINLQGIKHCHANEALQDIYNIDLKDQQAILDYTDQLSFESLKSVLEMQYLHVSEMLKVISLQFFTKSDLTNTSELHVRHDIFAELTDHLKLNLENVEKSFNFHKNLTEKIKKFDITPVKKNLFNCDVKLMHLLLHSLMGHLHTAYTSLNVHETKLENQTEENNCNFKLSEEFIESLSHDMHLLKMNLTASKDCFDEIQQQIDKFYEKPLPKVEPKLLFQDKRIEDDQDIVIINDPDLIQDEVYEAFITKKDQDKNISFYDDDNRESSRKQETAKVMSELKNVITERAELMNQREQIAIDRRNKNAGNCLDKNLSQDSDTYSSNESDEEDDRDYKSDLMRCRDVSNFQNNDYSIDYNDRFRAEGGKPNISSLMNMRQVLTGLEETFANDSDADDSTSSDDDFIGSHNYDNSSQNDDDY